MKRLWPVALLLVVAGILGTLAIRLASRDHPVALPLDDAYIYLQYARSAAEGHPGIYSPGAAPSAGATSLLWWGLVTVAAILLKLLGTSLASGLPVAALILNTLVTGCTLGLAYALARRQGAGYAALIAPGLCLLSPLWLFGMHNGMETGLQAAGLLAAGMTLAGGSFAWLVLPALARPEGAAIALLVLGLRALHHRREGFRIPAGPVILVLVAAGLSFGVPRMLDGGGASAWAAKAVFTEPDAGTRSEELAALPGVLLRILGFGLGGARTPAPDGFLAGLLEPGGWRTGLWLIALGGGALLALLRRRGWGPLLLWLAASALATVAVAWDAQFFRYLLPAFPLLAVTAVAGWFAHADRRPGASKARGRLRPAIGGALLIAVAAGTLWTPRTYGAGLRWLYRGQCEQMHESQIRVGDWIRTTLPDTAVVATHDVGAIAFLGERPVLDLVGLVTPSMQGAYRLGEGALWEALDRLDPRERPTHAAVIPAWMPGLTRSLWSGTRVWKADPGSRDPVSQSFEGWELAWPGADPGIWPGGDLGNRPRNHGARAGEAWAVIDRVDLADLRSESAHDFRAESGSPGPTVFRNLGFAGPGPRGSAMEGGRDVAGTTTFRIEARRKQPARLVLRTAALRDTLVTVWIGSWSAELEIPRDETHFREPFVPIPEDVINTAPETTLTVRVEGAGYRAFHWWLLQPVTDPDP